MSGQDRTGRERWTRWAPTCRRFVKQAGRVAERTSHRWRLELEVLHEAAQAQQIKPSVGVTALTDRPSQSGNQEQSYAHLTGYREPRGPEKDAHRVGGRVAPGVCGP